QAEEKLDLSLNMEMNNLQLSHIDSVSAIKSSIKPYSPPPPSQQQQQQQHKWYRSSPNVRCYKCNRIGHFAQDCYSKNY
ncbi:unnamed protein product, partial [Rotaria magnacalcarata]